MSRPILETGLLELELLASHDFTPLTISLELLPGDYPLTCNRCHETYTFEVLSEPGPDGSLSKLTFLKSSSALLLCFPGTRHSRELSQREVTRIVRQRVEFLASQRKRLPKKKGRWQRQ